MREVDGDRQLTLGELARAIESGSIHTVVRDAHFEITWREVNQLRFGRAEANLWLLFQPGGSVEIRPGGEDISQAI
jgi:hypothetical protein